MKNLIVSTENYNVDSGILLVTKWIWLLSRNFFNMMFCKPYFNFENPIWVACEAQGMEQRPGSEAKRRMETGTVPRGPGPTG